MLPPFRTKNPLQHYLMQHQKSSCATEKSASDLFCNNEGSRNLRIVDKLSRFLAPSAAIFSLLYLFNGHVEKGALGLVVAAIFVVPSILVKKGKSCQAKAFFFAQFLAISFLLAYFLGPDGCTQWIVVLTPALAYLLFPKWPKWIYPPIGIGSYLLVIAIYNLAGPFPVSNYPEVYRFFLAIIITSFLYFIVLLFEEETTASEKTIRLQRDALLTAQEKLEAQNEALKLLNTGLQQFAHHASHDMREPLRTISSFSTLLSRRLRDQPSEMELLGFIEDGSKRMTKMLEDLLEYAKVGVEEAPLDPVDLTELLKNVQKSLRFRLENSGAAIESSILPIVKGHQTLLTQLFQNLIGNSLKYHRPEVPPRIDIHFFLKNEKALLVFRDNGIGMEKQYLKQIFEPFRRLHGRSEFEGSGIGLATCRKITELYSGKIWAESEVGVGSTFYIEWPAEMILNIKESIGKAEKTIFPEKFG